MSTRSAVVGACFVTLLEDVCLKERVLCTWDEEVLFPVPLQCAFWPFLREADSLNAAGQLVDNPGISNEPVEFFSRL